MKYTEIAEIISGGTPNTSCPEYWDGDIPWLSVVDFSGDDKYVFKTERSITNLGLNNSATKLLQINDIIISARGTIGSMAMIPFPMAFNQSCFGIRAKECVDPHYLYYLTKIKINELQTKSKSGNIFKSINLDTFEIINVDLPNLEEQRKIVSILNTLDNKISLIRSINKELEEMAKEIYDYWFVQFDFPDANGRPYKSSGGAMVYNPILKREIPEGWNAEKLANILNVLKDGTHNPPKRIDAGIPLLTGTMFGDNFLEYGKATYISEEDYKQIHKKYSPKQFDVIITKIGTLGNVNLLTNRDIPIAIHCNSALLRFPDNWGNYFPFLMCKSPVFYSRLKAVKGQSIQEFASLDKIGSIYIEVPDNKTMSIFNNIMEPIINKLICLREEIIELEKTKNELLPLLMTGQVKIN